MTTSDMRYAIAIDTAAADAALLRVRNEVTTLAGQENALAKATDTATAALTKQGAAAAATSPKVETFQQRVAKLPDILGKQAAAISLVSSSLEGMGGGIGKAVAGAGQLAAAYGAGGPYALALVAAVGVGDMFVKHLHEVEAAQDAAFTKNFEARYGNVLRATERIKALKEEVVALERAVDPENTAQGDLADLQESAIALRKASRDAWNASLSPSATRPMIDAAAESARLLELEAKAVQSKVNVMLKAQERQAQLADAAVERTVTSATRAKAAAPAAAEAPSASLDYSMLDPATSMRISLEQQLTKVREEEAAKRAAIDEKEKEGALALAAFVDWVGENSADAKAKRLAKEEADTEAFNNTIVGIAQTGAGLVAGASQQLAADLIGNQEHALENFRNTIMAQAGQALVSYGTQAIGAGTLSALTGNPALAAIQIGGGAALIAAGAGLGGYASALTGLKDGEAGGSARGASPRTSTGTTGAAAGPTQITVVYAPSRDEGAAAVALAGKNAERRGLMNNRTR